MRESNLPPEIYNEIFKHLPSKAELLLICRVSRQFNEEGSRVLYQRLTLTNRRTPRFISTISSSPLVASFVQELNIELPIQSHNEDGLRTALQSMPNLRLLGLWGSGKPRLNDVLTSCAPTLQVFNTDCRLTQEMANFLASRPRLRVLRIGSSRTSTVELRPIKLPNLRSLTVTGAVLKTFTGFRSIVHLELKLRGCDVRKQEVASAALQFIGPRLLTFSLTRSRNTVPNAFDSLVYIANLTPNLHHFALLDAWENEAGDLALDYTIRPSDLRLSPEHWRQMDTIVWQASYARESGDKVLHLPRSLITDHLFGALPGLEKVACMDLSFGRSRRPTASYSRVGEGYMRDEITDETPFAVTPWKYD